jgi:phage tail sheath protein FI
MLGLFRAGAFAGRTPAEAFLVKCDEDTMTQDDLTNGRLVVLVGFAALKPTEFVVFRIDKLLAP